MRRCIRLTGSGVEPPRSTPAPITDGYSFITQVGDAE
ncbi:hypothetical protein J2S41_006698 [Catenuloplanes atrovinosus]|uniref:Uncharacterized protein n=1 Tax=Catenuloplanes atrovinosus TaxID=137266 RepID=A0AAE3YUK2_9ACTN|nr:hypothetical protein [Catenuloplanes atrovinosus]